MTDLPEFPAVTQLAIALFFAAMVLEIVFVRFFRAAGDYEVYGTLTSLLMGTGNVIAGILFGFISFGALMWFWQLRFFDLGFHWWVGLAAFLIDALRYYIYHRMAHCVRWVWAEHVSHHSSQHYNLSTALRQSWTGQFTGMFILQIPLVLLGFHPAFIAFVYGFNLVYQFWIHAQAIEKLPKPVEFIFNTPSDHRVHHATNSRYLDANYAGTLIIWDRIFGTFVEEDRPRYGIVKNIGTFNPFKVAFNEWVGIWKDVLMPDISFADRLRYLYMPS